MRQGGVLSAVLFTLYIDIILNRLEDSGLGCYVAHEYFGALCSADDLALLAPNFACLESKIRICESFGQEYDLLFNVKKTVCILFSGRSRRCSNPPPLYINNVLSKWTKSAKYLGGIVTNDLTESEEITQKRNDFIGRANVMSNFKQKCVFKSFYVTMLPSVWFSSLANGLEEYYRLQHSLAQGHPEALMSAKYNTVWYLALSCRRTVVRGAAVSQNRENVQKYS